MPLFEAYFDESGSHEGSEVLRVAGYIYQKEDRLNLDWQWKEVLDQYRIPFFRMVDCAHGNKPFDQLTKPERIASETRMIELIKKYMRFGISATIRESDFDAWNAGGPTIYESAYSWCCYMCIIGVAQWANANSINEKVSYFFEAGHRHQAQSETLMHHVFEIPDFRYLFHSFVNKRLVRLIQSADILAWQAATFRKRQLKGINKPRADFLSLARSNTVTLNGTKEMFDRLHARAREFMANPSLLRDDLDAWAKKDAVADSS